MASKSRFGQTDEIWTSILEYLNRYIESLETKDIAEYLGLDTAKTGNMLRQMAKKSLICSEKIRGKRRWWIERPERTQYGFFAELLPNTRPQLKRKVRAARKHKGTDARGWISVAMGKKSYEKSPEVSQAKVTWKVADSILERYKGSPTDLRIKLSWGAGSTAEWECGCKVVTSWKYARADVFECGLPVCLRNVSLSKRAPATNPTSLQAPSISITECAFTFTPPKYMPLGQTYTLTCGCSAVVAEVVSVSGIRVKAGVLANGIGTAVCVKHKTPRT